MCCKNIVFMLVLVLRCCLNLSPLSLVSPSLGVASLRPRLGDEPPWFTIFISNLQVLIGRPWKLGDLVIFPCA